LTCVLLACTSWEICQEISVATQPLHSANCSTLDLLPLKPVTSRYPECTNMDTLNSSIGQPVHFGFSTNSKQCGSSIVYCLSRSQNVHDDQYSNLMCPC
jgi:hypothetical protein